MRLINLKYIKFVFIELLVIILCIKNYAINFLIIEHHETLYNGIFQTFVHDSPIIFGIVFLSYISYFKSINYYLSILLRFIALSIFILYIIDIFILKMFMTHILFDDIVKYISYAPKYILQIVELNIIQILLLILFILLSFVFIIYKYNISKNTEHTIYIFVLSTLLIFSMNSNAGGYVHSWIFKNFIEYNIEVMAQNKEYTEKFKQNFEYKENTKEINTKKHNKNIIILMVESLSSYQSKYFSNIKDWTPNLDKIAKENTSLLNFYSTGFMTEDAELSILTGLPAVYAPKIFSDGGGVSFNGFYNIKKSIPNILNNYNYKTEFITSADLDFSNTRNWAKSIGFDYIEGSENKYYDNKKRYHFKAPSDKYLYDRVIARIKKQKAKYFIFIKTVSSHVPFINPDNEHRSEEETIRYVDKHIGIFYNRLKKINFFKNGILVIVGDHHPLIPLKNEEIATFGYEKASSMVPMIISFGDVHKELIKEQFSQVDIFNTIKNYITGLTITSPWKGDFLIDPIIKPEYILHRRGDKRGIISVFKQNKIYNVKLNGDNTQILNKYGLSKIEIKRIINKINYERIQRGKNKN